MRRKSNRHHGAPLRKICFITGTRAEFGLMSQTLDAISKHRRLKLRLVVTGMHLDRRHGRSADRIRNVDLIVPWKSGSRAAATGSAIASLAKAFRKLKPDAVMVVGDRVEAFAGAAAAHLCDIPVAHIHGGDRAAGQVDDSLRHAITKLAHIHFPATRCSARRILNLGEDPWRIHRVGSPGIDGIRQAAATFSNVAGCFPGLAKRNYALVVLHPEGTDANIEFRRAGMLMQALNFANRIIVIYPNNDPGSAGIIRRWELLVGDNRITFCKDIRRELFLALLRDAAVLIGNSSSGIIEAASFGTPVVDIGRRQLGRERANDVRNVPWNEARIRAAAISASRNRATTSNPYYARNTARRIAHGLATIPINEKLLRKLIRY